MNSVVLTSDETIIKLIECPKAFRKPPKKAIIKNRNIDRRFEVYAQNNDCEFTVFITQSERMPQDFSIGLLYDDLLLLRCNGFHGTTKAGFYTAEHHQYPHLHILTVDDIQNGRDKKPSKIENLIGSFVDLDTAILFFCQYCGIIGYEQYFKEDVQIRMSDEDLR